MTVPTVPLKRVAAIRVSNVDKKSVDGEHSVRLCNYTDVYYRDRITPDQEFMVATASRGQVAAFRLRPGDVIITKDSETADDIGVPALVAESAPDLVCGYHLAMLRPLSGAVEGRYLFWSMAASAMREQLAVAATGVTRFGLRSDSVGTATIALPPIEQQRGIADFLDAETARIDALITKKRRLIELLNERTRAATAIAFGAEIRWASGTPVGLGSGKCIRLGALAAIQSGLTLDSGRDSGSAAVTRPYLRVANVQDGHLNLSEVKTVTVPIELARRCELRRGDVLMTEGGDLDKLGRGTVWSGEIEACLHQNHVFAVRPGPLLLPEYLALLTGTPYGRAYFESTASKTTGIASTSTSKIAAFRVPLLPVGMQSQLVGEIRKTEAPFKAIGNRLVRQIFLLQEHRQALVTAAVIGQLDVTPGRAG